MSGEDVSMAERDQNEGSEQQPPMGQQNDNQTAGQGGQEERQPFGQQGQQPLGEKGDFGTQEPGLGSQANHGSDTATLSEASQSQPGSSPQQPNQNSGGFVGSESEDSGEYLQEGGTPQAGFAEQGGGAPNDGSDIERDSERSQNRESDIEGSSGNI